MPRAQARPKYSGPKLHFEKIAGLWPKTDPQGVIFYSGNSHIDGRRYVVKTALVNSPGGPTYELFANDDKVTGLWQKTDKDGKPYYSGSSRGPRRIFIVRPTLVKRVNGPEYELVASDPTGE